MTDLPKRVCALLHVPFEGLGQIRPWLEAGDYSLTEIHLYRDESLPQLEDFDWLIVMGGPMSVHDENMHAWLSAEKALIKQAIAADKTLLGICLGAQLIAEVAGGRVVAGEPEIGWWPLEASNGEDDRFGFHRLSAFHWHGEQIQLPPEARLLASSQVCKAQAFQMGRRILGLQFHLETNPASARLLVENAADELVASPYVQDAATIQSATLPDYQQLEIALERVLDYLASAD